MKLGIQKKGQVGVVFETSTKRNDTLTLHDPTNERGGFAASHLRISRLRAMRRTARMPSTTFKITPHTQNAAVTSSQTCGSKRTYNFVEFESLSPSRASQRKRKPSYKVLQSPPSFAPKALSQLNLARSRLLKANFH
jgi:hypothetical protein